MKDLRCKFGRHSLDRFRYIKVVRYHKNGKKYHRNYGFCKRCGKLLFNFAKVKIGGQHGAD